MEESRGAVISISYSINYHHVFPSRINMTFMQPYIHVFPLHLHASFFLHIHFLTLTYLFLSVVIVQVLSMNVFDLPPRLPLMPLVPHWFVPDFDDICCHASRTFTYTSHQMASHGGFDDDDDDLVDNEPLVCTLFSSFLHSVVITCMLLCC